MLLIDIFENLIDLGLSKVDFLVIIGNCIENKDE